MNKSGARARVSVTYFLFFASIGAFMPYISLYLGKAGWSGASIGLYLAIGPLITFITQPLWGFVGDLWGNLPKLFAILMLLSGISVAIFAFLPASPIFLLLAILIGFFQGPLVPMLDSMSVRILGENKNKWGTNRLWGSLGFAMVALAMGRLFAGSSAVLFAGYFLGAVFTSLAGASLPFAGLQETGASKSQTLKLSGLKIVLQGPFLSFLLAIFILQLGHYMPANFLSLVMDDRGASTTVVGLAWSMTALIEIPVLLGSSRLLRKYNPERLLIWAGLFNTVRIGLFSFAYHPLVMLLVHAIKGITFGITLVTLVLIVDRLVPKDYHATGFTLHTAFAVTLPQLLGGLLGGRLYDLWAGEGLFLISASLSLLGTVALTMWHSKVASLEN